MTNLTKVFATAAMVKGFLASGVLLRQDPATLTLDQQGQVYGLLDTISKSLKDRMDAVKVVLLDTVKLQGKGTFAKNHKPKPGEEPKTFVLLFEGGEAKLTLPESKASPNYNDEKAEAILKARKLAKDVLFDKRVVYEFSPVKLELALAEKLLTEEDVALFTDEAKALAPRLSVALDADVKEFLTA